MKTKMKKKTNKHTRISKRIQYKNKKLHKTRLHKYKLSGGAFTPRLLGEVMKNFKIFVWDFDDTIAHNIGSTDHLSLDDRKTQQLINTDPSGELLKKHFFGAKRASEFVDLVSYLVENGKIVKIISFGKETNIIRLLTKLFELHHKPLRFDESNVYGESKILERFFKEDRSQIKKDILKSFGSDRSKILFFDDDIANAKVAEDNGFKGITLIGSRTNKRGLEPSTIIREPGFSIEILYLINKLLMNNPLKINFLLLFNTREEFNTGEEIKTADKHKTNDLVFRLERLNSDTSINTSSSQTPPPPPPRASRPTYASETPHQLPPRASIPTYESETPPPPPPRASRIPVDPGVFNKERTNSQNSQNIQNSQTKPAGRTLKRNSEARQAVRRKPRKNTTTQIQSIRPTNENRKMLALQAMMQNKEIRKQMGQLNDSTET